MDSCGLLSSLFFVCLPFILRLKTIWKERTSDAWHCPSLPLRFDRVPIHTAAGGPDFKVFSWRPCPSGRMASGKSPAGHRERRDPKSHFCWRRITQRPSPFLVVVVKPPAQTAARRQPIAVILQIDVLIFGAAPQPFDEPVVDPPSAPVHAHIHPRRFHHIDKHRQKK